MHKKYLMTSALLLSLSSYASLIPPAATPTPSSFDCSKVEASLTDSITKVKAQYLKGDVSDLIEGIETLVKKCPVPPSKKWEVGLIYMWKKSGYEAEIKNIKKEIEHNSKFKEVNAEVELYKKYAKKLGYSEAEVEKFAARSLKKGKDSLKLASESCGTKIDLRNDSLGAVRDQDSVGWCYSFASADLLTYKLGKKVSAVDVAVTVNDTYLSTLRRELGKGEKDIDGASIGALQRALAKFKEKGGACLEAELRSEDNGTSMLFFNLLDLETFKKTGIYKKYKSCPGSVSSMFPNMSFEDFNNVMDNTYYTNYLQTLVDKACVNRQKVEDFKVSYSTSFIDQVAYAYSLGDKEKVFEHIDRELSKKNILLMGYYSSVLTDTSFRSKPEGSHASVIVGRRFDPAKGCEYLVRNSWGRSCGQYDKSLSCEEGNVWVPKNILIRGISDAISIQ